MQREKIIKPFSGEVWEKFPMFLASSPILI
jgi:hypothetical protein